MKKKIEDMNDRVELIERCLEHIRDAPDSEDGKDYTLDAIDLAKELIESDNKVENEAMSDNFLLANVSKGPEVTEEFLPKRNIMLKPEPWDAPKDWQDAKEFELGKAYQHRGFGGLMHVVGKADTIGYGPALIAESQKGLVPVGAGPGYTDNWREVPYSMWLADWLPANSENGDMRERYALALEAEKCEKTKGLTENEIEADFNDLVRKAFISEVREFLPKKREEANAYMDYLAGKVKAVENEPSSEKPEDS